MATGVAKEENGEADERTLRIIDAAIALADEGGFQGVRLRDVAARSGVALGTLYARFSSKEDILTAALETETRKLEILISEYPIQGESPLERLSLLFGMMSKVMFERENFARAVLRSVSSGVPGLSDKILAYRERMTGLVVDVLRGPDDLERIASEDEERVAFLIQQIWFAAMVGWMGGVEDEQSVLSHTSEAACLLLSGMNSRA